MPQQTNSPISTNLTHSSSGLFVEYRRRLVTNEVIGRALPLRPRVVRFHLRNLKLFQLLLAGSKFVVHSLH